MIKTCATALLSSLPLFGAFVSSAEAQSGIPHIRDIRVACLTASLDRNEALQVTGTSNVPNHIAPEDVFEIDVGTDEDDFFGLSCKHHWALMGCTDEKMRAEILPDNYRPPGSLPLGIDMYGVTPERTVKDNGCFVRGKYRLNGSILYATCCALSAAD